MQQTRLSRRWLMKIAIFLAASSGLGLWGLYDATIAYPVRGQAYAQYMEYQYLKELDRARMLELLVLPVHDPDETLSELKKQKDVLERTRAIAEASGDSFKKAQADAGLNMLQWLQSLKLIGELSLERCNIDNPRRRLSVLAARWQARDQPKPLSGFDIPMQWGFVIVGFGLAGYLLLLVAMVGSKKYRYDSDAKRLTFPGGASITPGDIEDINKRKWDKFIVQIKSGGRWRKLDLLRYDPLEEWFLEMEKETSFYEPPEDDPADDDVADDDVDTPDDEQTEPSAPSAEERTTETA